jgi:formylglycine-generating enzyme required for sulfatase activity
VNIPDMREIPAGPHFVGAGEDDKFAVDCERPRRRVDLDRPFLLAVFPATCADLGGGGRLPATGVSWYDAADYCRALSQHSGRRFRLPTEIEWEIACRAGTETPFWCGCDITPAQANFLYDESGARVGPGRTTPRGAYPPNAFGLEDMAGNVLEWCIDEWLPGMRVIRGGAWDLLPRLLRSSWRDAADPGARRDNIGFRVACDL